MVISQVLFVILASIGVFAIVWRLVREILLSEWFNEKYTKRILQRSLDRAYSKGEPYRIDEEYYKFKLAQLSARTYKERELALDYFDNVPSDHRLIEKLIEILPKQRRKDIQKRIASLLAKTLNGSKKNANNQSKQWRGATANEWGIAIALWLTEIFWVGILWFRLIDFSLIQSRIFFYGVFSFFIGDWCLKNCYKGLATFWKSYTSNYCLITFWIASVFEDNSFRCSH